MTANVYSSLHLATLTSVRKIFNGMGKRLADIPTIGQDALNGLQVSGATTQGKQHPLRSVTSAALSTGTRVLNCNQGNTISKQYSVNYARPRDISDITRLNASLRKRQMSFPKVLT